MSENKRLLPKNSLVQESLLGKIRGKPIVYHVTKFYSEFTGKAFIVVADKKHKLGGCKYCSNYEMEPKK